MDHSYISKLLKEAKIKIPFAGYTIKTRTLLNFIDTLEYSAEYIAVPELAEMNLTYFLKLEGEREIIDRIEATDAGDESELVDYIADDEDRACPFTIASDNQLRERVSEILATLTPREERVLRMRFGIGCREHTLVEAGALYKLSRTRISQIEVQALHKLRHPRILKKVLGFLEDTSYDISRTRKMELRTYPAWK